MDKDLIKPFESPFLLVLDTNILLGAHRQTMYTFDTLKLMLKEHYENLWIPWQVWEEYLENCKKIYEKCLKTIEENYKTSINNLDKMILRNCSNKEIQFSEEDAVAFHNSKEEIKRLNKTYYRNERKKYSEAQNKKIIESISGWLEGKIGGSLTVKEIIVIMTEGEIRYANKLAPGYEDLGKTIYRFGDLIIWKEIIKEAKTKKLNTVFISEDLKDDWTAPRSKRLLAKEFYEGTGKNIQLFSLNQFVKMYDIKAEKKKVRIALEKLAERQSLSRQVSESIKQQQQDLINTRNIMFPYLSTMEKFLKTNYNYLDHTNLLRHKDVIDRYLKEQKSILELLDPKGEQE